MSSKLLIEEHPLQVLPSLAVLVGLNEAIFLQQLHYWLNGNGKARDGRKWVYNTYEGWAEQFPFWSVMTIRRIVKSLRDGGHLTTTDEYNKSNSDRTLWYTINYDALVGVRSEQANVQCEHPMCSDRTPHVFNVNTSIYRTETTTETTAESDAAAAAPSLDDVFKTWGANMPGIMTEIIRVGLVDLTNDYSVPEILKAISIACERNKRTLGYVRGILDRGVNLGQENGNGNYANITLVRMDE